LNVFVATIKAVTKRPFILIFIGILMLAAAVVNSIVPVVALIVGLINMTGGASLDVVVSALQMLLDPVVALTVLVGVAVLTLLISACAGLLLPGYLLTVDDGLSGGAKKQGLFRLGIKRYFFKFFAMTLKTSVITVILGIALLVATLPAIVVTRVALSTKPELLPGAIFIDVVTALVFFLCVSFYKSYVFMWYMAGAYDEKKPFAKAKALADRNFWRLSIDFLLFDLVLAATIYMIYSSDSQLFRYVSGWAFTTLFFTVFSVYLVNTYRKKA